MSTKILTVQPQNTVEQVLKRLTKEKQGLAVVADEKGRFLGVFSRRILLEHLLPVSVNVSSPGGAELKLNAAPGIIKRLRKVEVLPVEQFMSRKAHFLSPDDGIGLAVQLTIRMDGYALVRDPKTETILGVLDSDSVLEELLRLKETEA